MVSDMNEGEMLTSRIERGGRWGAGGAEVVSLRAESGYLRYPWHVVSIIF